jgi:iron complex transport system ATP-binding protein
MLTLEQVCFGYEKRPVIENISLEVPRQAFMALIGPNGGGKTTLLRLMSKVLQPQQGTVLLDGKPLAEMGARDLARRMAVITSEQFFEFPYLVSDVVAMGRSPHLQRLQRMSQKDWDVVDQALRLTHVDHLALRPVSQLSSGERQRVLIARAITQQPSILMLDEPNGSS